MPKIQTAIYIKGCNSPRGFNPRPWPLCPTPVWVGSLQSFGTSSGVPSSLGQSQRGWASARQTHPKPQRRACGAEPRGHSCPCSAQGRSVRSLPGAPRRLRDGDAAWRSAQATPPHGLQPPCRAGTSSTGTSSHPPPAAPAGPPPPRRRLPPAAGSSCGPAPAPAPAPALAEQQRPPAPKPPPLLRPGTRSPHLRSRQPAAPARLPAAKLPKAARGNKRFLPGKAEPFFFSFPRHWVAVSCRASLRLAALGAQGPCGGALAYGRGGRQGSMERICWTLSPGKGPGVSALMPCI